MLLQDLCKGTQRKTAVFGEHIGKRIPDPELWLQRIADALTCVSYSDRNFDLLEGFIKGLSSRDRDCVNSFKLRMADLPKLAAGLPGVCARLGLVKSDVSLMVDLLQKHRINPLSLGRWAYRDVLADLPDASLVALIDELIRQGLEGTDWLLTFSVLSHMVLGHG